MKKLTTLLSFSILFCSSLFSQITNGITYQGVVRNASGEIQVNQAAIVRMSIKTGTTSGPVVWQEQFTTQTNDFGLINLVIGTGVTTGVGSAATYSDVNWGGTSHFLEVEIDFGSGMASLGTTQFLSVPYAYVADTVLNTGIENTTLSDLADVNTNSIVENDLLAWDGTNWVKADSLNVSNIITQGINSNNINTSNINASTVVTEQLNATNGYIVYFSSDNAVIDTLSTQIISTDSLSINGNVNALELYATDLYTQDVNATGTINAAMIETDFLMTEEIIVTSTLTANNTQIDSVDANYIFTEKLGTLELLAQFGTFQNITSDTLECNRVESDSIFTDYIFFNASNLEFDVDSLDPDYVNANEVYANTLTVNSNTSFADSVEFNGPISLNGGVDFNGNVSVSDTLITFNSSNGNISTVGETSTQSLVVGTDGTSVQSIIKLDVLTDVPQINPGFMHTQNLNVPGATLGSVATVSPQFDLGTLIIATTRVSANGIVTVKIFNPTGTAQDPSQQNFHVLVVQ